MDEGGMRNMVILDRRYCSRNIELLSASNITLVTTLKI